MRDKRTFTEILSLTSGLIVGNGDCFPDEFAKAGRKEMMKVLGQKQV